MVRVTQYKDF